MSEPTSNGEPQFFIMERGLTESACEEMAHRPDNGLRIDGQPVSGEGRCIPEDDLPEGETPASRSPV